MRIAIEAQRVFRSNKHGMDMVVLEIIRNLQKIDTKNEYWIFTAPGPDRCLQETSNFHIVELKSSFYPYWEQVLLPLAVHRIKADILHCTSNTAPLFGQTKLILTLHDVIALEKKNGHNSSAYQNLGRIYTRSIIPYILKKCHKVVTVSNYEKECIVERTNIDPNRIRVIYNGYSTHFDKSVSSERRDYLFFLGSTNPKKNTLNTLAAYREYIENSTLKLPLKIADISEQSVINYLREINSPELIQNIQCLGYVSNKTLPEIYGHAAAFLYTSLRESFGIPQLEAMACGTPVIVSNTSALPEIAGEGAILVDPMNPKEIAAAILRLETDSSFNEGTITYGLERVKFFSWAKTATEILDLYESSAES